MIPHNIAGGGRADVPQTSPLQQAVDCFNATFNWDLRLPMWRETVEQAAVYAELRGRADLATALRLAPRDCSDQNSFFQALSQ